MNEQQTYAAEHADPSKGFVAVPRWFRRSAFWQGLGAAHRAVLDELYHRIARNPVVQKGTGITLERGQWAISLAALAEASGASVKQVRAAIDHATRARVIGHAVSTRRLPTRTLHLSLFTWLDFEAYDKPKSAMGKSLGTPPGNPLGKSPGKPLGKVIHSSNTPLEDTKGKTVGEEVAATPLSGAAAPAPSAPLGTREAGSAASPTAPKVRKPCKSTRAPSEIENILRSDETRLAYLTGGPMQWWPAGQSHTAVLPVDTLTAPQLAGAFWYYVASARGAAGATPAAESLPAGRLIGQIANTLKTTPTATVWGWLEEAYRLWQAARGRVPDITPELVLQSWWREKLKQPRPAPVMNTSASLCTVADIAAFGAELDAKIGKVRL